SDGKRRAGGLQTSGSAVAAWHGFLIRADAAGAGAQPAQHAEHAPRLVRGHVLAGSAPRGRRGLLRPFRRRRLGHHLEFAYDNGHTYPPICTVGLGSETFMLMSCPGVSRRGFSMPLAAAMACQLSPRPRLAAIPCNDAPAGACAKGCVPAGPPPGPAAPGGVLAPASPNANFVIFCCVSVRLTLARRGRPSGEKNSKDSSIASTTPSNWKVPQRNCTAGGSSLLGSLVSLRGVMK